MFLIKCTHPPHIVMLLIKCTHPSHIVIR
jgi:hypothetical protein